jgi:hypothetical protein
VLVAVSIMVGVKSRTRMIRSGVDVGVCVWVGDHVAVGVAVRVEVGSAVGVADLVGVGVVVWVGVAPDTLTTLSVVPASFIA